MVVASQEVGQRACGMPAEPAQCLVLDPSEALLRIKGHVERPVRPCEIVPQKMHDLHNLHELSCFGRRQAGHESGDGLGVEITHYGIEVFEAERREQGREATAGRDFLIHYQL